MSHSDLNVVLIVGSAPDGLRARDFDVSNLDQIVAINNAWRIRDDWTHAIYPQDFALENRPPLETQGTHVTYEQFVPANNAVGGVIYVGATMAYTAAAWALDALKPDLLACVGCDMVYDDRETHFYGKGIADPLRNDPTLQDLEAKSNRLLWLAAQQNCLCVNLSLQPKSRLTFPRLNADVLSHDLVEIRQNMLADLRLQADFKAAKAALDLEQNMACFVESGDYWNYPEMWEASKLKRIDEAWRQVFE